MGCKIKPFYLIMAVLLFSQIGSAQNSVVLSGHTRDQKGNALAFVNISIEDKNIQATSDENGYYQIPGLSAGTYKIEIKSLGFQSLKKSVIIEGEQPQTLDFHLIEEAYQIDEVLMVGQSAETKIEEQSYNVEAVNAQKFYNSSVDAAGILDRLSSVRVMREGGFGSDYSFSLNGFTGDQVKFFLDGIPMDNYGSFFSLSTIPANTIQRIEIYNGVVPVWLGNDALGGAVNIITNQKANYLDVSYTIGSFNTHQTSVNAAYTHPKTGFTIRGNMDYNYSENDYDVKVEVKNDALGNERETRVVPRFHDRYRAARANIETGFVNRSFADQLLFGVVVGGDDKQVQNGSTMNSVYGGITQNSRSAIGTLKYRKNNLFVEDLDINLSAAYMYNETQNIDTLQGVVYNWAGIPFVTPDDLNGELGGKPFDQSQYDNGINSQFNAGYQLNTRHSFAFNHSFEYFNRSAFDRRDPDKIINQFPKSLYKNVLGISYKYDVNQKWSTTLFGKVYFLKAKTAQKTFGSSTTDGLEVTNENFGYGLASSYFILPNLQAKFSFEHTYRLPKSPEIFGDGLFILANPGLKPEQSDNLNIDTSYDLNFHRNHNLKISGSFIYRNSKNLIFQVVSLSSPETSYSNLSDVRTYGAEGNLQYSFKDRLQMGANLTYQNITDQADFVYNDYSGYQKNFNKGERLPNRPYLFGNANAGYRFEDVFFRDSELKLNYYFHFVKEYYLSWANLGNKSSKNIIPEQASHDIEAIYSLSNGRYNIGLEIRNLTDEWLYDKFYLQKPGRAFYLKLRYSF